MFAQFSFFCIFFFFFLHGVQTVLLLNHGADLNCVIGDHVSNVDFISSPLTLMPPMHLIFFF